MFEKTSSSQQQRTVIVVVVIVIATSVARFGIGGVGTVRVVVCAICVKNSAPSPQKRIKHQHANRTGIEVGRHVLRDLQLLAHRFVIVAGRCRPERDAWFRVFDQI